MAGNLREGAALLARTVAMTLDFTGRSRRLEIAWYWVASIIVTGCGEFAAQAWLEWQRAVVAREALALALALPIFALFVRRLHDQGRSGWWALMLPPLLVSNIYTAVRLNFHGFDPALQETGYWHWLLLPAVILMLLFMVAPGEIGPNVYGPDPRLEAAEPEPA